MPHGNYAYLSAAIENSFLNSSLSVLVDYDVPISAIQKLGRHLDGDHDWPTLMDRMRELDFSRLGLLPYERHRLEAVVGGRGKRRDDG